MLPARSVPLGGARPRDGPAAAQLPLADSSDRRDRNGSRVPVTVEPRDASGSPPFEPRPPPFAGTSLVFRLRPELEAAA